MTAFGLSVVVSFGILTGALCSQAFAQCTIEAQAPQLASLTDYAGPTMFNSVQYGSKGYLQSIQLLTWQEASSLCQVCNSKLAELSASIVDAERGLSDSQLWIGSYDGGLSYLNLAWFTGLGQVVLVFDGTRRLALCELIPQTFPSTPSTPSKINFLL